MRIRVTAFVISTGLALFAGCSTTPSDHLSVDAPHAQLFGGLGTHTRTVSTTNPEAQAYFDEGLAWMYSFNHDEAIRSFARAAQLDPECAMAWWGIAVCEGPNYNDYEMTPERNAAAWAALQEARARKQFASPLECELIDALSARYAMPAPEDRSGLEQAYADAMGRVWAANPGDSDVGTLYAEAMMVQRPWKLYSAEGMPEGDTPRIVETLEAVMAMDPGNAGANHLYIHAVEPSRDPGRGTAAAERLCQQVPTAGHMNHMPSHIYVQTGEWAKSIEQNAAAMHADAKYLERSPDQGIQHMYMVHNAHMLAYSAMMVGREAEAMAAARSMWANIPPPVLEAVAPYIDLWMTSVYDVQKRFGRWKAILAEDAPPSYLPITTAVWRAHRAIACAALHDFDGAAREREAFFAAKERIPEDSVFGFDPAHRILTVSEHFIDGEIALQQEDWDTAARHLEAAVEAEDSLWYGEPPQWLQPTRHTLGAVYLKAGRFIAAEQTYREDLERWPNNGWSLYGLYRALSEQGRAGEAAAVLAQYDEVWAAADEATTTSCKCIPQT
ncbi:MAG: tetratricopeptide repeat protein [Myxococcales bacterium]|nr:tetratricopeptide repeat protein [Myxococcales bacterium]